MSMLKWLATAGMLLACVTLTVGCDQPGAPTGDTDAAPDVNIPEDSDADATDSDADAETDEEDPVVED